MHANSFLNRSRTSQGCQFVIGGLLLLIAVVTATVAFARVGLISDLGDALTRNTVRLSLAWYAVALCLMMRLGPDDWSASTLAGSRARWCWTWAIVCFLVHLGVAFHYYHHWSHAHAFERTRQVSGVGEGIYVSYLFTWLWIADAAWWWLNPRLYAVRSIWIDRTLHLFMLFIVFNGMVVFEQGLIRWVGLVMFAGLTPAWINRRPALALST